MKQTITIEVPEGKTYKQTTDKDGNIVIQYVAIRSKSWEEFCKNHNNEDGYYINLDAKINKCKILKKYSEPSKNILTTKEDAEGILALIQLTRLHDEWVGDWKPLYRHDMWIVGYYEQYKETLAVQKKDQHCLLQFPTEEIAQEFLNCFENLIIRAKKFI